MSAQGPTSAQLAAANLVVDSNPQVNGKPIRSYDSVHKNFPPIETVYVTPPPPSPTGLPFMLGVNSHMIDEGTVNTAAIGFATAMGMKVYRNDLIWNGSSIAIQTSPGVYNQSMLSHVQATVTALKAAGIVPLIVVTGSFSSSPGSTPQDLANTMAYLVSKVPGIHWELINEPDGSSTTPAQLTQMMKLAYPAMKKADPTCVVHGLTLEHAAPAGFGNGTDYYNACVSLGIIGNYDVLSVHEYNLDKSIVTDCSPNSPNYWGLLMWENFAKFRQNMLSKGDTVPMWVSECNWPRSGGSMTPALQSQYLQDILTTLSGEDTINNVPFSEYLKAFCIYQMYGSADGNWGLYPADFPGPYVDPVPAVAMLTALG